MTDTPKFPPRLTQTYRIFDKQDKFLGYGSDEYLSLEEHQATLEKCRAWHREYFGKEITRLTKYAQHLQDCAVYTEGKDDAKCSCGFSEVSK